jgi:hypothetical protein
MFLRHEGFLGALGAFMSYEKHGLDDLSAHHLVERFPMGAPYVGGKIHGPPLGDLNEKARTSILDYRHFITCILCSVWIARSINFDMELYLSDIMDGEVCAERYSDYSTCTYGSSCYDRHGRL